MRRTPPVAIVSELLVRLVTRRSPIPSVTRLSLGWPERRSWFRRGVVGDIRQDGPADTPVQAVLRAVRAVGGDVLGMRGSVAGGPPLGPGRRGVVRATGCAPRCRRCRCGRVAARLTCGAHDGRAALSHLPARGLRRRGAGRWRRRALRVCRSRRAQRWHELGMCGSRSAHAADLSRAGRSAASRGQCCSVSRRVWRWRCGSPPRSRRFSSRSRRATSRRLRSPTGLLLASALAATALAAWRASASIRRGVTGGLTSVKSRDA